jgi:hypothetical protein
VGIFIANGDKNEIVGFTVAVTFLARGAYFGLDTTHVSDPNTNPDPFQGV